MSTVGRNAPCPCGSGKKYKKCCMVKKKFSLPLAKIPKKRIIIYLVLICIVAGSVFARFYGFNQPHMYTFDEALYGLKLGNQLKENLSNYSTKAIYEEVKASGRPNTPDYLNSPLFKHPPLFPYLIAFSYTLFSSSPLAAVGVSIFFASLMIITLFILGRFLYDYRVGLLATLFLCLDPIHWLSAEKIWMETTVSFFMLAAVLFFALKDKNIKFLIASGISVGFAMLTKHSGALILVILSSFAVLFERPLLKKKEFWSMLIIPILMFLPWVIWNWQAYGGLKEAFVNSGNEFSIALLILSQIKKQIVKLFIILFVASFVTLVSKKINLLARLTQKIKISRKQKTISLVFILTVVMAALFMFERTRMIILSSLAWQNTYVVGWSNPFASEPLYFYFKRLPELSPIYIFSFFSMFLLVLKNKKDLLLVWVSLCVLVAFSYWRNFQCRYVLAAVPFLLLLAARLQVCVYDILFKKVETVQADKKFKYKFAIRVFLFLIFVSFVVYALAKTIRVDILLAAMNNFAYF